jgi:hypothetical protein
MERFLKTGSHISEEKMKKNCWEILGCEKKECPVISEERLNGIHDGLNAGRACWVVAGTRCRGKIAGTFAAKIGDCRECQVYQTVAEEEGMMFKSTLSLLAALKETIQEEIKAKAVKIDEDARKMIISKFKAGASGTREDVI